MAFTNTPFYNSNTRKIIVAFGVLFRNITIQRPDGSEIPVPLAYGSKQKWYSRLRGNPDLNRSEATVIPRIGFEISDWEYDTERKLSSTSKLSKVHPSDANSMKTIYQPVPWNLNVGLFVWAKTMDDILQILEQIIPFFKPSFNITISELGNDFNSLKDIPITLTSVSMLDEYEGPYEDFRVLQLDLLFTVKMNYHGPVKSQGLIKEVIVDSHIPPYDVSIENATPDNSPTDERYKASVDPESASIVDEYEILESLELYPEGDPVP